MAKKKTTGIPPTDTAAEKTTPTPRRRAATPRAPGTETAALSGNANGMSDSTPTLMSSPAAVPIVPPTYDQIAEAAYLRYLNRGGGDGRDFEDWLEAEQELKGR